MQATMPEMREKSSTSKTGCCMITSVLLVCLAVVCLVFLPNAINSQARSKFGNASTELSFRQHLYLSAIILFHARDLTEPVNPEGSEIDFTIDSGEPVSSIVEKLHNNGLISDPSAFSSYLQYAGLDTILKAGDYTLNPAMTPLEIAQEIQSSISANVTLSILAGWRVEEIANSLPSTGFTITSQEFLDAVYSHPSGYSFSSCLDHNSLEGYLAPGTYSLPRGSSLNELIPLILMNFESQVTPALKDGYTAHNLNLCQAVTLASIVQREAMVEDEMSLIASVFYNRLNVGMPLESDPTVQYALGYNKEQATWWTNPLSKQDLQVDSAYNTYLYPALPPGPIANPGLAALTAVAFPDDSPYYYFRAACDNSSRHVFAETYNEHLANACP
jgi:UPF0755 protein